MTGAHYLKVLSLTIFLKYRFFSIFMVTYLPTILINIINQATNYITGDSKYDLIVTVNMTSMMVLASIYLSVSTSLPNTQSIKPVEEWLLFNLAYPFLVIVSQTFRGWLGLATACDVSTHQSNAAFVLTRGQAEQCGAASVPREPRPQ